MRCKRGAGAKVDVNINIKVPGLEKLLEYVVSGIGAVASPMLAPYVARQQAKAKLIASIAEVDSARLIAEAHADARRALLAGDDNAMDAAGLAKEQIAQRLEFQEQKRHMNIVAAVSDAAAELGDDDVSNHEPDHDWTARFFEYVQDVSSEDVRKIWARILAGEVKDPGGVSMHTLSILRNLSRKEAKLFEEAMRYRIEDFIIKDACVEASNVLTAYDLTFGFEDIGLFRSPINARPARRLSLGNDGVRHYVNGDHVLCLKGPKSRSLDVEGSVVLKPAAMELARFCDAKTDFGFLAILAKRLKTKNCVLMAAPFESIEEEGVTFSEGSMRIIDPAT